MNHGPVQRRARPALGTLVEVGVRGTGTGRPFDRAFAAIAAVEAALSRFDAGSEVTRFHALPAGGSMRIGPDLQTVLRAARALGAATAGAFDVTLGSGPAGWRLEGECLRRVDAATRFDLGGIGKGHAVDRAVEALRGAGCSAGWVNAGGDLRVFGDLELPIHLRDEVDGGSRPFIALADGALATSRYGRGSRSSLHGRAGDAPLHVSVAAPSCLWADALTKVVALSGRPDHPLLGAHGAQAWRH